MYEKDELDKATKISFVTVITFTACMEPTIGVGMLSAFIANQGTKKLLEQEKKTIKSKCSFLSEKERINGFLEKENSNKKIKENNQTVKEINKAIKEYEKDIHNIHFKKVVDVLLYRFEKKLREE